MALLISKGVNPESGEDATLTIQGTNIALDSIYARIELAAAANGVNMQMGMFYYQDAAAFDAGSKALQVVEMKDLYSGQADIEAGETQTILLASQKVKAALEAEGYNVTIEEL